MLSNKFKYVSTAVILILVIFSAAIKSKGQTPFDPEVEYVNIYEDPENSYQVLRNALSRSNDSAFSVVVTSGNVDSDSTNALLDSLIAEVGRLRDTMEVWRDEGYNGDLDIIKTIEQAPMSSECTDYEPLVENHNVRNSFQDVGAEVGCEGYTAVAFHIVQDINGGTNVKFQILGKHEFDGSQETALSDYFVVDAGTRSTYQDSLSDRYYEIDDDEDGLYTIVVETKNLWKVLQLKACCDSAGTATQLDYVGVTKSFQ